MRLIAATVVLIALPFSAQAQFIEQGPPPPAPDPGISSTHADPADHTYGTDLHDTREAIERRRESGELSKAEARRMRRETAYVDGLAERYARDGLSEDERRELDMRASVLRSEAQIVRTQAPRP
jgi:hypothetical protein